MAEVGDDWKAVCEKMCLKNKREAILEFMRATTTSDEGYLFDLSKPEEAVPYKNLKESSPLSQADLLFLQCDLLKSFVETAPSTHEKKKTDEQRQKRRLQKEKRKLLHKMFVRDLFMIQDELKELKSVDSFHARARIDCKNLAGQMFSERFNLAMTTKSRLSQ